MEQLIKAKESLELKKAQTLNYIEKALSEQPELLKAFKDLNTINAAIEATETEISRVQKAKEKAEKDKEDEPKDDLKDKEDEPKDDPKEDEPKEEKDKSKKGGMADAVEAVLELLDSGDVDDDKIASVAEEFGVLVEDLKDAVEKELD